MECVIWELPYLSVTHIHFFCATWMSQVQGFGSPKLSMRKRSVLSIRNRGLQEQMGVTDFSRMARATSTQDLHH